MIRRMGRRALFLSGPVLVRCEIGRGEHFGKKKASENQTATAKEDSGRVSMPTVW